EIAGDVLRILGGDLAQLLASLAVAHAPHRAGEGTPCFEAGDVLGPLRLVEPPRLVEGGVVQDDQRIPDRLDRTIDGALDEALSLTVEPEDRRLVHRGAS